MPKSLPDTVWISERPGDHPAGREFLVSTHEPISGNPEPFVRKAEADRLARALRNTRKALARADTMLPDDTIFAHNAWAAAGSALMDYDPKGEE